MYVKNEERKNDTKQLISKIRKQEGNVVALKLLLGKTARESDATTKCRRGRQRMTYT